MKVLSLFNNKGGVGKTTLTYHLAHILAEPKEKGGCGKKVLLMDLDPQSNLTIFALNAEQIGEIWNEEKPFLDMHQGYQDAKKQLSPEAFKAIMKKPRSMHFLLRPTEEGITDEETLPPPVFLNEGKTLGLLPGRLSLYTYESVISQRWSATYLGVPLSIRTVTKIRNIATEYAEKYDYDYVIMDTSPSLGILNRVIISMADGFIIPCFPDLFSLYGMKNIGDSLKDWENEFQTMNYLLKGDQKKDFPKSFVQFLGYVIYNAKRFRGQNEWDLAQGAYNQAKLFPDVVKESILINKSIPEETLNQPIGGTAIMHSHNTFASQAQKYNCPIWELPRLNALGRLGEDAPNIMGNQSFYFATKENYRIFAESLLERIAYLETPIPAQL